MHIPVSVAVEFTIAIVAFLLSRAFVPYRDRSPHQTNWADHVCGWNVIATYVFTAIGVINLLWYWTI